MMSRVVPVSPSRGKMREMLLWCASALVSVIASVASVTLRPSSNACRAVDSTPMLVEMPANDDLGDAELLQLRGKIGAGEGAPRALDDGDVAALGAELRDELCPIGERAWRCSAAAGCARRGAGVDGDENERKCVRAEGGRKVAGVGDDGVGAEDGGIGDDPFLQIDHDERGFWVERGDGHWCSPKSERWSC